MKKIRTERICKSCKEPFRARGRRVCCDTICYLRYRNSPEYVIKRREQWLESYYRKKHKKSHTKEKTCQGIGA